MAQMHVVGSETDILVAFEKTYAKVPRPMTYEEARYMVRAFFPGADPEQVAFSARLEAPGGERQDIVLDRDIWEDIAPTIASLRVEPLNSPGGSNRSGPSRHRRTASQPIPLNSPLSDTHPSLHDTQPTQPVQPITVTIKHGHFQKAYSVNPTVELTGLFTHFAGARNVPPEQLLFYWRGRRVEGKQNPHDLGMDVGSSVALTALDMPFPIPNQFNGSPSRSSSVRASRRNTVMSSASKSSSVPSSPRSQTRNDYVSLRYLSVDTEGDATQNFSVLRSEPLHEAIVRIFSLDPDMSLYVGGEEQIGMDDTAISLQLRQGTIITDHRIRRVRKPVIYLFPPEPMEAKVNLSLTPEWEFDVLYPAAPIEESWKGTSIDGRPHHSVSWTVDAEPNGDLWDKESNTKVAYLFWEAKPSPTWSRFGSPRTPSAFSPLNSVCHPENSVLLFVEESASYLDRALRAMGLHTEAVTSFITYWLPCFMKHTYVALRFIPQIGFEEVAPLEVEPKPDVVARIFMLFQPVMASQLDEWSQASDRAVKDPSFWRDVVGIDIEKQKDPSLFRVVEWGGMEAVAF
ncbi:hypothetical protein FRC01_010231 [Tulasnella sp. 417]|nr:hypothetical protein FRC01_010231 [Tulasnella sp. 417]